MDPHNINFSYIGCSKDVLEAREASFNEDIFYKEIKKLFETAIKVNSVNVEIKDQESQKTEKFIATVIVHSPDGGFESTERGSDAAKVTRDAIKSAITKIHNLKEKKTNHHK